MPETDLIQRIIKVLDETDTADPEAAHSAADTCLFLAAPVEVQEAYNRLKERCSWWATA